MIKEVNNKRNYTEEWHINIGNFYLNCCNNLFGMLFVLIYNLLRKKPLMTPRYKAQNAQHLKMSFMSRSFAHSLYICYSPDATNRPWCIIARHFRNIAKTQAKKPDNRLCHKQTNGRKTGHKSQALAPDRLPYNMQYARRNTAAIPSWPVCAVWFVCFIIIPREPHDMNQRATF